MSHDDQDEGLLVPRDVCGRLLSVVVPVFNEELLIGELVRRLAGALTEIDRRFGTHHEIVFVSDGSTDATLPMLIALAQRTADVRVLSLSRNFGHQAAITAGTDVARGDAVVVIDGDLQDPPEVIGEMVARWADGYGVVYGRRARREGESAFKVLSAKAFYRILGHFSDLELPLDSGDFRLMDRAVVEALRAMREESRYIRGMVVWVGFPQYALEYARDARYAGTTKYSLRKMVRLAVDGITSFSTRPLDMSVGLGVLVTLLSFIWVAWIIYRRVVAPTTVDPGWTSLLAAVLFLGGIQLISIGVLGTYMGRVFHETKHRPLYVVAGSWGGDTSSGNRTAEEE